MKTTHTPTEIALRMSKTWAGSYRGISFRINLHSVGESYTPGGEGVWCFYVYIQEKKATDFSKLWLEDKIYRWKPEAEGRIHHDYAQASAHMEFNGGCTYYQKHGHTDGYRSVEFGCDYNHLWDNERGGGYTKEYILFDVQKCIDSLYENGVVTP